MAVSSVGGGPEGWGPLTCGGCGALVALTQTALLERDALSAAWAAVVGPAHGANGGRVSLANSAEPGNGDAVSFETVSPDIARARIDQFETARDFQASRVTALQARQSQNEIYSPCDCLVAWALSSSDGTYINESEKIMTLMRTGDDEDN